MAAVLRDTTLYANIWTNKYVADARDRGGRCVPLPFELVGLSPATVADTYNLTVVPMFAKVIDLYGVTDGLGASVTASVGDSGSAARYVAAGTSLATTGLTALLAITGMGFKPTADTIVVFTGAGAAITVGKLFKGFLMVIPPA
jgi:hypothetical protein